MFKCKACEAHKLHIESLEREITRLHDVLAPKHSNPYTSLEANAILNGTTEQIEVEEELSPAERDRQYAIIAEREALLSGTY